FKILKSGFVVVFNRPDFDDEKSTSGDGGAGFTDNFTEKFKMQWLILKKPFLLGTDFPRWENLVKPEGFFDAFYAAGILMLAPCINLENIMKSKVKLTALPLNIPGTSCVPCRAIIVEE
ncbi:MAG: hypothetical protein Q7J78_03335, partial [Clostridiales bacterium]|nr:hypothetical protein [Clostridiales bacterium]